MLTNCFYLVFLKVAQRAYSDMLRRIKTDPSNIEEGDVGPDQSVLVRKLYHFTACDHGPSTPHRAHNKHRACTYSHAFTHPHLPAILFFRCLVSQERERQRRQSTSFNISLLRVPTQMAVDWASEQPALARFSTMPFSVVLHAADYGMVTVNDGS
jgi:hypothetical protein